MTGTDKFGNKASLGNTLGAYGYVVYVNGKKTTGRLVDLYLENGLWTGTNTKGNKYQYTKIIQYFVWKYIGKGTVTANISEYQAPISPSSPQAVPQVAGISDVGLYYPGGYPEAGLTDPSLKPFQPKPTGLGGTITFGDQPTELLRYAGWLVLGVVAIVFFIRPRKRRRKR